MHIALGVDYLKQQGLVSLEEIWSKFAWKRGTAGCGPACPVVREGSAAMRPLPRSLLSVGVNSSEKVHFRFNINLNSPRSQTLNCSNAQLFCYPSSDPGQRRCRGLAMN